MPVRYPHITLGHCHLRHCHLVAGCLVVLIAPPVSAVCLQHQGIANLRLHRPHKEACTSTGSAATRENKSLEDCQEL
eukprot:11740171-Prorocentrum_lima.AAC.1